MRKKFLLMFLVLSLFSSMGGGLLFAQNGNVAEIGGNSYSTLAEAAAAAQAGSEIKLLANATVEGTLALPAGIKLTSNGHTINGNIRMLGNLELNGALTITGGLWVGKSGETLTATLSGDKLTASYFMFQRGTYTINADIDAVYGYLSYEGTFEVNSTIHTTGANGEVLYINGNVTLNDDAVLDSDNSVFVCNDNAVLTLKPGSMVDSNVKITKSGAKLIIDATGMAAGESANITGTVTNDVNGTIAVVGNDNLEASIVDGKVVLAAKPAAKIGEQGYATLAAAYEAAVNGDVIVLNESVTTFPVITKAVTFKGGKENAAVEINYALSQNFTAIDGIVRFENLTFNKPLFTEHGGNKPGLSIEFEGCNFNVNSEAGYGILIGTSWSNSVVKGLKVNNCNFKYVGTEFKGGYMLYVQCVNEVTITNNTIDGNNLYRGAIHLGDATEHATVATVSNNTIKNFCRGVMMGNRVVGSSATISGNTFDNINYSDKDSRPAQECAPIFIHSIATAEALQIALTNNEVENCANPMIYSEDTDLIKDYVTEFTGNTVDGAAVELANSYYAPNQIFPVATINDAEYFTLQEAVNAAVNGDVVTLLTDNAENVTVTQKPDVKFTIDGADKTMTGTITIDGKSAAYATAGITVKNMNFTAATEAVCINLGVKDNNNTRYTNNVTVESCNFTGTDKTAVGIKSYTGGDKNLIVNDCIATGMHSLMQLKNTAGVSVTECEITDSKNGISLGASSGVAINGTTVKCEGYGVRADANGNNGNNDNATITDCTIEAFIPVVVRNASNNYGLQFNGTNTMTPKNTDGLWCAIGTSEYETNGTMPTAPTGQVTVTLNDTGLSMDGVYGEHFALNGEGTAESPYLINNLYELKGFRDQVNAGNNYAGKYVKLAADIDLNNEEWTPIGNNNTETNRFQGYFDGNNKTISNLKVTGNTSYKGFFGYIKGTAMSATTTPSVKDLTLDGVNVSGDRFVGGLSGQAYTCNITNVTVKGEVSGVRYVGGLVGHVYTYFKNCHFIGNASCSFDALGGIAGAGDCRAYDCSVIGDVTGSNWVGGIVGNGQEGTSAVRCYVKGDVKTSTNWYFGVGGIAGVAGHGYSSSEFKNNYFDGEVYLEGEKVPAMIIGIVNAENNETINATIEGNSWNTTYYDVNIPVYVTAEAPQNGTTENWIAGASEELTKPRNNNLIMLESDLQYVTEEDYVIMSFSEVTEEQVEQALINNAVAKIGETTYTTLQKALDAAAAGTGNVTVEIIKDIDLTNVDWNPVTVSAPGYPVVTVNGNNKTITGLNDMLFAGTWAGNSGLIINDLTIANSTIVNDKDDAKGTVGVGAFIGFPQASATITLNDCHLVNSTVEGGHWTGGLIGYAAGYAGNDGPVFMNLTIKDCSVTESTITGKGSVGGIIGHGSGNAWTNVVIEGTTVSGNTITSTGSSNVKAGAVMGTIGAAGQPTTVNGVTHTGGMSVSATVADNTVKSNGTEITTIYGRQGTETGMLYVAGGTYDNYPIEQNVAYAKPAAGLMIEQNENGTYGLVPDPAYGKVAMIGETYYETLQEAVNVGGEVKVIADITLTETVTVAADKTVVLDLNGKTINAGWADETAGKHIYAFTNNGTLTIKGEGTINARGNYNYGTMTLENGTINGIDVNGGFAIGNYGGATFTMKGGAINVYEDDPSDSATSGNYDATALNNEGTAILEGGTITSTSNYVYAVQNTGSLTIKDGMTIKGRGGVSVTLSSATVTVEGGNIQNDEDNNSTGHAFYVEAGELIINGGNITATNDKNDGNSVVYVASSESAKATINGGNFTTNEFTKTPYGPEGCNITIKGGTFDKEVNEKYLADGFICEQNADGTYGVVEGLAGEGTEENPYLIKSLTDLTFFRDAVNAGNKYAGKYIKLTDDIDLAPTRSESNWTPIGNSTTAFQGTFDGDNHTISNLVINGGSSSNQGFFGFTTNGEIKNVIFNNAKVSGRLNVGVVAGTPYTSKYTNIKVTGHVEVNGMAYVGGVGGKNAYANWTDITVSVDETSYVNAYSVENGTAYRTYVGGVIGFNGEGGHTFKNITSNIKVIGSTKDVGGIFGILHYGNKAENVTFTGAVEAPADAKEVGGIAGVWHNEKGQTVTITNAKSEGTVKVGDVTTTGSIVGGAYNADNETANNSGSLIIDGNETWLKVAQIGEAKYLTLIEAVAAVEDGGTITLIANETFTENNRYDNGGWWDGLGYSGDKSFTIDLANFTISQDGALNDYLMWFKNDGAKANTITLKNGTLDAGTTAYCALATASSNAQKITVNLENIKVINNNNNGSTVKVRGGAELNVKAGTVITGKDSYLGIECIASTANIYEGAEIYMNGTSSYNGCLAGVGGNGTINVYGGEGKGVSGGFIAMTSGGTINVEGGKWIANNDGTYANSNKSVLVAQSDKQYNAGAGNSIVNVTGGTFKGGYNCYGNAAGDAQINIRGGNFNADPTSYVVSDNYKVVNEDDGTYTVEVDGFEKFYTAAGVETTSDNAAYSLSFTVTDYASKEVSVKIGNKNPAENKGCDLLIPSSVKFNDQDFAVTSIPVDGFRECKGFDKLVVPGTITSVSNSAFYNCSRLTEVVIEEGVQKLGSNTFYKISDLQTLTLPSTLTRIESLCFNATHSIKTIVCNAQTPPTAFTGSFTEAVYKNALLYVDGKYEDYKAANGWSNFKNILAVGATQTIDKDRYTLIATITDVWNRTCSVQIGTAPTNTKRAELAIPEHVSFSGIEFDITSIPEGGFQAEDGLQSCKFFEGTLTIPAYITSIGKNAFKGCTGVTALVVEEDVTSLGTGNTFYGCRNIETITLPSTLTKIPSGCFNNILQKLQVVECHALVPPTLSSQFTQEAYNSATLYVHDVDAYKGANNWKLFKSIRLIGAVAQNKETEVEYKSIAEAVAAANAGETVQMLQNVDLENTITVAAGKEVVLDLNGKTVSYTTIEYVGEAMITNNGNLTITDSAEGGKLSYAYEGGADSSYGFGNSTIENKGVLTINAGTVENTSEAMSHASYAINTGAGATLNVEGGNILNLNGHAVRMVSFGTTLNTVNIEGGYIEGTRALQVQLPGNASAAAPEMELNITGGELKSNEENYNLAIYVYSNGQSAENVSVEISGGTFNGNVAVNAAATNSMLANAVVITDGTFNGYYGVFSYSDEDAAQAVISITGGTFATNNSEWYAEDEQYVFEPNENGTYSVVEQTIFTQTTQLSAGWNWFSAYVETDLASLQSALVENLECEEEENCNIAIKDHYIGTITYYPEIGGWYGNNDFTSFEHEKMYMIQTPKNMNLQIVGEVVNPEEHQITIVQNWNMIGYVLDYSMNLENALASIYPVDGDYIKSQHGYAEYLEGIGWYGPLSSMEPGHGYKFLNKENYNRTLKYPTTRSNSKSELRANITTDGNYWTPNASQYPNNMTMTAMVDIEGGDYEVAAFVDGEVRGSARPIYVEPIDAYVLFLTIHGEGVEEMTFKFYDLTTGEESALNDRMNYSDDAIVGSLKEPYMFKRGTTGIGETAMSEVNIYPNPTTTGKEINLQATCDKVEVFNALGVKVAEYQNVDSIDALETAGIYVIRITNDSNVQNCRLVVK